jgi:hypothetical protein
LSDFAQAVEIVSAPMDGRPLWLIRRLEPCSYAGFWDMFRLPDFSVVVWVRRTDDFASLKAELLDAAAVAPYESTEYQGMVDFHWGAASFGEAKKLADTLKEVATRPELVVLRVMSRVDGVDSFSIKDARRTKH